MADYKKELEKYTRKAGSEDIKRVSEKISGMNKGPVKKIWDTVAGLYSMVRDPDVPWQLKAVALGALVYLISPLDAVPDIMPLVGLLDDVAVITAAASSIGTAFIKYREKKDQPAGPSEKVSDIPEK